MHVGWPHLLPIALHLRNARTLLDSSLSFRQLQDDPATADVLRRLAKFADAEQPVHPPNAANAGPPALDGYFSEVANSIEHYYARAGLSPAPQALLATLLSSLRHLPCRSCAELGGAGAHVCTFAEGAMVDDDRVRDTRGVCIDPIRELFEQCVAMTRRIYGLAPRCPPVLTLVTGIQPKRDPVLQTGVFGATSERSRSADALRRREVKVSLSAEGLTPADYLSLPCILFHECFVHGFCGVAVDEGSGSKAFHEGWMDWIAMQAFERELRPFDGHLGRIPAAATPADVLWRYRREFVAEMERLRALRYAASPELLKDVLSYRAGKAALMAVRYVFVLRLAGEIDGDLERTTTDILIRVSTTLNAHDGWSHASRIRFITSVLSNLDFNNDDAIDARLDRLPQIREWVDGCLADAEAGALAFGQGMAGLRSPTSPF